MNNESADICFVSVILYVVYYHLQHNLLLDLITLKPQVLGF